MNTRESLKINGLGHLEIGGIDSISLAERFGTPLYVLDEAYIRKASTSYVNSLKTYYGDGEIAYASKAFCTVAMFKLIGSLGLSADVVSAGEIHAALKAGFPMQRCYFHGNNKTAEELELAVSVGVGVIVAEDFEELSFISALAEKHGKTVKVMLRVNPGIEAHTHEFVQTAKVDSKFGIQLTSPALIPLIIGINDLKNVKFYGLHVHIGSQIFDVEPYLLTIDIMMNFIKKLEGLGVKVSALNLGGGFAAKYTDDDEETSPEFYAACVKTVAEHVALRAAEHNLDKPHLVFEPGRSIIAEAGVTLYTVGAIKNIENVRKYVAVNGGMFENPRYALYGSKYSAIIASRASEEASETVTIAGKCCESGDIITKDVMLQPAKRGDILAVFSTGAYNYSMSSHYNMNLVPPVVLVSNGKADYVVKPETYDDLLRLNVVPDWIK